MSSVRFTRTDGNDVPVAPLGITDEFKKKKKKNGGGGGRRNSG